MATQGAVYPFVVYSTDQTQPSDTKDGPSVLDVVSISILTFAKSHITALEIAAAIRAELDRYGGTAAGVDIQSVRFVNQMANQMDLDKHIFIIEQMYEAREVRQ
jgi:siroheme synthase (precorrin-2 oxidase/ferrochelatase)